MKEKKKCAYCGKQFEGDGRRKYCSPECKEKANAGVCVICGKPTKNHRKTCSPECERLRAIQINHDEEHVKASVEKIKKTKLERYGSAGYNNLAKMQETNLERYGATTYMHSEEGAKKVKETMLERYGVEHALQADEFKQKVNDTIAKTGKSGRFHTPEWDKAMLDKYGTTVPYKNDSIKAKGIATLVERYGVTSPAKLDWVQERSKATCMRKYGVEYSFQSENNRRKSNDTCFERYGMSLLDLLHSRGRKSKINEHFAELLGVQESDMEVPIGGKYYDLRKGDVLIEVDPTVTHNSDRCIITADGKPIAPEYHLHKSEIANENGYKCIHVFDWDSPDKIKALLSNDKPVIGARECEVAFVDKKSADSFLETWHLQGKCEGDFCRVGLVHGNDLVGLMTFGTPRYDHSRQVELLRMCFSDVRIIGGAEKMFGFFLDNYKPNSIVSYCDLSKFSGSVYERLGFRLLRKSKPSAHWFNIKTKRHITDNLLRQFGFDKLFNANYGKGTSNETLMLKHGFLRVYDCGQATYAWSSSEEKE